MPPDQFEAYVSWPKDMFYYLRGLDPANEAGSSIAIDEDFNTELDDFLGRED